MELNTFETFLYSLSPEVRMSLKTVTKNQAHTRIYGRRSYMLNFPRFILTFEILRSTLIISVCLFVCLFKQPFFERAKRVSNGELPDF